MKYEVKNNSKPKQKNLNDDFFDIEVFNIVFMFFDRLDEYNFVSLSQE